MCRTRRVLLTAAAASLVVCPAASAADIEGTWTFGEGQVSVIAEPDGRYLGTVVTPTSFSQCAHPAGQRMWVGLTAQPDSQYFGGHQWFADGASCDPNGPSGPTAFRVLVQPDGGKLLRVCFTSPNRPDSQPSIAPDGSSTGTVAESPFAYGNGVPCSDSRFVGPVASPKFGDVVTLPKPGRRKCLSRRNFRIRLRQPAGDPLVRATVLVNGRRVAVATGERLTAGVDLRGLPKGRYTVKITAKTLLGRTVSGTRKYRTCTPKRRG